MIHYQLRCGDGHGFEGWFRDSTAFEDQAARGLLSCPQCGVLKVDRALMAPSVRTSRDQSRAPQPQSETRATAVLPDEIRAALQRLRGDIERHCDDVGAGFADAARRLHDGKPVSGAPASGHPPRGIYGQATGPEREALAEEGIEVMRIPWLPRAES